MSDQPALIDLALAYAKQGWPVFPLMPKGKQPLAALAPHGVLDATTDPQKVTEWWTLRPEANIGGATGHVGDAMDLDTVEAMATVLKLCDENSYDITITPRASTGGGGRHVIFKATGMGNRAGFIEGVDWRGKGGYIVMPGSIHPNGKPYEWIVAPIGELPEVPEFILELLRKKTSANAAPASTIQAASAPEEYIRAAVDQEIETLRRAKPGTRNDTLNRASYALGTMVGAGWITQLVAESLLKLAAYAIGLEEPEISRTIRSGMEDGVLHPRQPIESAQGGEIRGSRVGASQEVAQPVVRLVDAPTRPRPTLTSGDDFMEQEDVEPDWIVDGLLIRGGLSMVNAKPKVGKSVLVRNLAMAVAKGRDFLGRHCEQGVVFYLAHEEQQAEVRRHFRKLGWSKGDPIRIFVGPAGEKMLEDLVHDIAQYHPVLVIIDPLFKFTRAKDVNDYAEVNRILRPLEEIAQGYAVSICVTHHAGKADREGGDVVLGSTAIFGGVETLVILKRRNDESRVVQTDQRYGPNMPASVLQYDEEATGMLTLGGSVSEFAEAAIVRKILLAIEGDEMVSRETIRERTELRRDRVIAALERLIQMHHLKRTGQGTRVSPYLYSRVSGTAGTDGDDWGQQGEQGEQGKLGLGDSIPDVGDGMPKNEIILPSPPIPGESGTESLEPSATGEAVPAMGAAGTDSPRPRTSTPFLSSESIDSTTGTADEAHLGSENGEVAALEVEPVEPVKPRRKRRPASEEE